MIIIFTFYTAFWFLGPLSCTFHNGLVDVLIQMFNLRADRCILKYLKVLMKHISWPVEMGNHKYFVARVEVLGESPSEFGLAEGNDWVISKGMNAFSQYQ